MKTRATAIIHFGYFKNITILPIKNPLADKKAWGREGAGSAPKASHVNKQPLENAAFSPCFGTPWPLAGLRGCLLATREARVNSTDWYSRERQLFWHYVGRPSAESPVKAVLRAQPIFVSRDKSPSTGVLVTAAPVARSWGWSLQSSALGMEKTAVGIPAQPLPTEVIQSFFPSSPFARGTVSHSSIPGCGTAGNCPSPGCAGSRPCQGGHVTKALQLLWDCYICVHPMQLLAH